MHFWYLLNSKSLDFFVIAKKDVESRLGEEEYS